MALRIHKQIELAAWFASVFRIKIKYALFGDSNFELFRNWKYMRKCRGLGINIAVSNTRFDHWVDFLNSDGGRPVLKLLQDIMETPEGDVACNLGGKHVIQDMMKYMEPSSNKMQALLPEAWYATLPPLGGPLSMFTGDVRRANKIIRNMAGSKTVDLYAPFADSNGVPLLGLQSDFVHYSPAAQDIIFPFLVNLVDADD